MRQITDTLNNVSLLGIDSAPIIYFIEAHPTYVGLVRTVVEWINNGSMPAVSSVLTLTEVLIQPLRIANSQLENQYRDFLLRSHNFSLVPIDHGIAEIAAQLRARHNLRTPDALQVATAIGSGCTAFLSNDTGLRRVTEIEVILLDDYVY